jgi:hypothetical protein
LKLGGLRSELSIDAGLLEGKKGLAVADIHGRVMVKVMSAR